MELPCFAVLCKAHQTVPHTITIKKKTHTYERKDKEEAIGKWSGVYLEQNGFEKSIWIFRLQPSPLPSWPEGLFSFLGKQFYDSEIKHKAFWVFDISQYSLDTFKDD